MIKAYCPRRKKMFTWSVIKPKNLKQLIKSEGLIIKVV